MERDEHTFKWGVKKGIGGPQGDVQFYESFTYDGTEYFLYDCVYMFRVNQSEPDIGKLVKIWETPHHVKRVKVVWFFRPVEVQYWLGDTVVRPNELFLACGEGKGLFNLNPLEALSGKCNVVCMSKDKRNPQASEVELRMADFMFYRTFDVGSCKISQKFPDAIADIKVEYFFNKKEERKADITSKLNIILKEKTGKSNSPFKSDPNRVVAEAAIDGKSNTDRTSLKVHAEADKPATSLCCPDNNMGVKAKHMMTSPTDASYDQCLKKRKLADTKSMHVQSVNIKNAPSVLFDAPSRSMDAKMKNLDKKDPGVSRRPKDNKLIKIPSKVIKVTTRPEAGRNKWFKPQPWEDRMQKAHSEGTLVLLENLDHSYTSTQIEDIIWCVFKEMVDARVIERTAFSSPHYGQAFVIFKTRASADSAISELVKRCLLVDGRPVTGRRRSPRDLTKRSKHIGHLTISNVKLAKQREEFKNAVSTSHCSQPNTITYVMAMDWRLLQERSDLWWKTLHEQQSKEIEGVRRRN